MENYLKAVLLCFFLALWGGFTETNVFADILNRIQVREMRLSPPGVLNRGSHNQYISQNGPGNQDQDDMKRIEPGKASPAMPGYRYPRSPHYKTLVRVTGADPVYWLQNDKLYWVITPDIINRMSGLPGWGIRQIRNYPASVFETSRYVTGPRFISTDGSSNGLYIRKAGEAEVYKINNGRKEYVSDDSCNQTNCWEDIIEVTQSILDMFVTSGTPKQTIKANYNPLYVAKNGVCKGKIPCYATIQDALNAITIQEATINVTQETYNGNVVLNVPKRIYLGGGWDTDFGLNSSYTSIKGSITITKGTLILKQIVLTSE